MTIINRPAVRLRAFRSTSDIFFRGLAVSLIWIVASLLVFFLGMELARFLGLIGFRRDLTLMILRVPIPGVWASFLFAAARLLVLPALLGGAAMGFFYEIQPADRRGGEVVLLLIGAVFGMLLALLAIIGIILTPGFFNLKTGLLLAALLILTTGVLGFIRASTHKFSKV